MFLKIITLIEGVSAGFFLAVVTDQGVDELINF